ncbi:MAG TPA: dienelactone hydrolase family protein [Opitutaceae bacterium]|nr:dienelactone hydrolase family protein [Opitutaceae bacterium]
MHRFLLPLAAAALAALPLRAQDWARSALAKSPRHQEWITVKQGGREVQCFVVYPEISDKAPVVLVIHEIFGLSDWAQELADELAAAGYIAVAPDLLSGMGPKGGGTEEIVRESGSATRAVSMLPPEQVTADLNAVADYARTIPAASGKLAVAGFCWGGGQAFRFATHRKDLAAAFVFYGTAPRGADDPAQIACPVYGFYAGNDARISASVPATTELMRKLGKSYQPVIYKGAGHGFMRAGEDPADAEKNPKMAAGNKQARQDAWERWKALLLKL